MEKNMTTNSKRIEQLQFYFAYLDELRDSGVTNMFGAASYLADEFSINDKKEARAALSLWMKTFEKGGTARQRAVLAIAHETQAA
jgi:predicted deacetylase